MSASLQEIIALGIVALAVLWILRREYRRYGAAPLSRWFLKRGKPGLAFRVRSHVEATGCDACKVSDRDEK